MKKMMKWMLALAAAIGLAGSAQAAQAITFTARTQSKVYDGTALNAAYDITSGSLKTRTIFKVQDKVDSVTYDTNSRTAAGETTYTITSVKIVGGTSGYDYTSEYSPTYVSGKLTITPATISSLTLSPTEMPYTRAEQTVGATVKAGSLTPSAGSDYTISGNKATDPGDHTVTVTGKGNYQGTKTATWKIVPATIASVELSASSFYYDGTLKSVTVKSVKTSNGVTLNADEYTVSGTMSDTGSISADASHTVTVTANNANFTGAASTTWTITHPSGAPDSVSEKLADGQKATGSYDNSTKTLTVLYSTNLAYVAENTWAVGLTLALPAGTYAAGNVVTSGDGTLEKTTSGDYVTALNWTAQFTLAEVEAAVQAGNTPLSCNRDITVYGTPGIAPVTYQIVVPVEGIVLWDAEGRQVYPPHSHNWVLKSNEDGVMTVRCDTQDQCPQGGEMSLHLSPVGASDTKSYDAQPFEAALNADEKADFETHVGATVCAVSYRVKGGAALSGAPKDAGTYEAVSSVSFGGNDYALVKELTISTVVITDDNVSLSATELPYAGAERSVTVSISGIQVVEGTDYTVSGDLSGVGSLTADTEYTVTVTGIGNFSGTVEKKWTVKAPSGTISEESANEQLGGGQTAAACTLSGTTLTVDKSQNLCVLGNDADGYQWYAGLAVALNEGGRAVDPSRVRAKFSVLGETEYIGSDLDGDVGASNEDITLADGAITWFSRIKLSDVLAAAQAQQENLTFTMTVWQLGDENCANSIKPTTYTTVVPLADLILNDAKGRQCYPVHVHAWEVSTVDGQLTATCNVEGCPQKTKTLTLLGDAARTYNRNAQTFSIDGTEKEQFVIHTGWTVSDVKYRVSGGDECGAPADAGDYEAFVTVTTNGTDAVEFQKAFAIAPYDISNMTIALSATSFNYDTTEKTVSISGVTDGTLTLGTDEYTTENSVFRATRFGTYYVNVQGKGNFTGSAKTASWVINNTTTSKEDVTPSVVSGGITKTDGTNFKLTDSSALVRDGGTWCATVKFTFYSQWVNYTAKDYGYAIYTHPEAAYIVNDKETYSAAAIVDAKGKTFGDGSSVTATSYEDYYRYQWKITGDVLHYYTYVDDITWKVAITPQMLRGAVDAGKDAVTFTVTVGAIPKQCEWEVSQTIEFKDYTVAVPIDANLKLYGDHGNIEYDGAYKAQGGAHPYVAQNNVQKKYDTLAEALTAAGSGETVSLIASNAVEAAYTVKPGVALALADLGNANSTYVLQANEQGAASLTSATRLEIGTAVTTDAAGREVEETAITGGYKYEIFTAHVHAWSFEASGNTLTATCSAEECPAGNTAKVVIDATDTTWTGSAIGATVTDGFAVSTVKIDYSKAGPNYWQIDRDGNTNSIASTPKDVGSYIARLTVTVTTNEVETAYTIEKAYKILRPEAGYSDGYELANTGVRYDSYSAALSAARNGDTIACWPASGTINLKTHDYSSDKNITVYLNGKTLTYTDENSSFTVQNTKKGDVTLIGGTIKQSGGYNHDIKLNGGTAGGKLVLGAAISVVKSATLNSLTTQISGNVEYGGQMVGETYTSGTYYGGVSVNDGATLTIMGGKFNTYYANYMTATYIPELGDKRVVRSISEDVFVYEVVAHTHVWTKTASGNVLTVKCTGEDCDYCNYKNDATLTLNAENDTYTDETYVYAKASVSKDGTLYPTIDPSIVYYAKDAVESLESAPTNHGYYTAKIAFEGVTASKDFTVFNKHHYAYAADDAAGTITATCDAEGPCEEEQKAHVATLTAEDMVWSGEPYAATVDKDEGFPANVVLAYYAGAEEISAPTEVGSYSVVMSAGGVSVEKAFEITRKPVTVTVPSVEHATLVVTLNDDPEPIAGEGNVYNLYHGDKVTAVWTAAKGYEPAVTTNVLESAVGGETVEAPTVTAIAYAITYVLDGGENDPSNPESYTIESEIALAAPTKANYDFLGWTPDGGVIAAGSTGDKTFTAGWKLAALEFTVAAPANASVTKVATNGVALVSPYAVAPGTTVTVTYAADAGYLFANGTNAMDAEITVTEAGEQPAPAGTETAEGAAKIGTTYYLTLQDAFDAAGDGNAVVLAQDIADAQATLTNAVAITLDLAGRTMNCTTPKDPNNDYGYTLRVKAGRLTVVDTVGGGRILNDNNDSALRCCAPTGGEAACPKLVVKAGTFQNDSASEGTVYVGPTSGAVVEIEGGTFVNLKTATFKDGNASAVLNVNNAMAGETPMVVKGGTFSVDPALGDDFFGISYVAEGKVSVKAEGRWTVLEKPTVTVTPFATAPAGLDAAYAFTTNANVAAFAAFDANWYVTFDKAIEAQSVRLAGQYDLPIPQYDNSWTSMTNPVALAAGTPVALLATPITYAQMCQIGTFNCGVENLKGNGGTVMTVRLVLSDAGNTIVLAEQTYALVAKGPTVVDPIGGDPETDPTIKPVEGTNGVYEVEVKTNTTTTVMVEGLQATDTLVVPAQIDAVAGDVKPGQVVVVGEATNEVGTVVKVDITKAFVIEENGVSGVTISLNDDPAAEVTVTIGETTETIKVTPEFGAGAGEQPLVVSEEKVGIGVKTIPGLLYQIVKSAEVGFPEGEKTQKIGKPIAAKGTRLALEAAKEADPAAFYKVEVTK